MNWPKQPLGNVADLRLGKMLDEKKNKGQPLPYLGNINVRWGSFDLDNLREMRFEENELERYGLKYGDIVMCEGGEPGRCAIWKEAVPGMMIQKALHRIRPHESLDFKYLYYDFLQKGRTGVFARLFTGATIQHLPGQNLAKIEVAIPPLDVQHRIANILSGYDDLIENNRRRIDLLEQSARMLYKEWFVSLRFPGHEHIAVKDGVPQGWEKRKFGSIVNNFDNMRVPLSVLEREQRLGIYPYHGAAGILSYIDEYIFDGRYVLIGEDGTVITPSQTPMLQFVEGKFWVSNHAHVIQGKDVSTEFIYYFLNHYPINGHITGVAQPKITQANLNRIEVLIPTEQLLSLFQDFIDPLVAQEFILKAQNKKLQQARDLLLPRLMNGEIAV